MLSDESLVGWQTGDATTRASFLGVRVVLLMCRNCSRSAETDMALVRGDTDITWRFMASEDVRESDDNNGTCSRLEAKSADANCMEGSAGAGLRICKLDARL